MSVILLHYTYRNEDKTERDVCRERETDRQTVSQSDRGRERDRERQIDGDTDR